MRLVLGDQHTVAVDCLVDTGYNGYLSAFMQETNGLLIRAIGEDDFVRAPRPLPRSAWTRLADGSQPESWYGGILCNIDGTLRETGITLVLTGKTPPVPLVLGMALLRSYGADLTIHFSSRIFSLSVPGRK